MGPSSIETAAPQPLHTNKSKKSGNCFGFTWQFMTEATTRCFSKIVQLFKKVFPSLDPKPMSEPESHLNSPVFSKKKGNRAKILGDSPKDVVLKPVSQKMLNFPPQTSVNPLEKVVLRPVSPRPKRDLSKTNSHLDPHLSENKMSIGLSQIRKELGSIYRGIASIGVNPIDKLASINDLQTRVAVLKAKVQFEKENSKKAGRDYESVESEIQQLEQFLENKKSFSTIHMKSDQNKVLEPALKEIKSTELTFKQGLEEMLGYKSFFDRYSDREIARLTELILDPKDLKVIRDYFQLIEECHQVNSHFYEQIKDTSVEYIEGMVKIFLKHDLQSAFEKMGHTFQILLKSVSKNNIKKLFKIIQARDPSLPKRGDHQMLFVLPIQRAPRYVLLFRELLSRAKKANLAVQQLELIQIAANQANNVAILMNEYKS